MSIDTPYANVDAYVDQDHIHQNFGHSRFLLLSNTASHKKYSYVYFPKTFPDGSTIASATLTMYLKGTGWAGGPHVITAVPIDESWREGTIDWSKAPDVRATSTTVSVTDGVDGGAIVFDLATILQAVANGSDWYGIRLTVDTDGDKKVYAAECGNPDYKPGATVSYREPPLQPVDLRPSGGRACSLARPHLIWSFQDVVGDSVQAKSRLQIDDTDDTFGSIIYDTQLVSNMLSEWDLGVNLLGTTNKSDVETNTTGFTAVGSALTRTTSAGEFYEGAAALKIHTDDAAANEGFYIEVSDLTAEATYVWSGYFKGDTNVRLMVRETDGTVIATGSEFLLAAYARAELAFTMPAATTTCRVYLETTAQVHKDFFADALQVELASVATEWKRAFVGFTDNATYYWRVMVEDDYGGTSDWSDVAELVRKSKGTSSLSAPGATVYEITPDVTHSTLSGRTQEAMEYLVYEQDTVTLNYLEIYHRTRMGTSDVTWAIPDGYIRTSGRNYKVIARIYDTIDRDWTPGDPPYVELEQIFQFARSAVTGTTDLVVTTSGPGVHLHWQRASEPDYWVIRVDGIYVDHDNDGDFRFALAPYSGTNYHLTIYTDVPNTSHTYEIEAVTLSSGAYKHSDTNDTETFTPNSKGVWLVEPEDGTSVQILATEEPTMSIGEDSAIFNPISSRAPVMIVSAIRGYEGEVHGIIDGSTYRDNLETLKGQLNTKQLHLIFGSMNIPVLLGEIDGPTLMIMRPGQVYYEAGFKFYQNKGFTVDLTGVS